MTERDAWCFVFDSVHSEPFAPIPQQNELWNTCRCCMTISTHYDLNRTGHDVVHSYGRFIPHEFLITDLNQISGPDGIGRITCTVSSGTARFIANDGQPLDTRELTQTRNGASATLVVNTPDVNSFQNRELYCTNINTNYIYLYISSASKCT